jgi:hypothetical protein
MQNTLIKRSNIALIAGLTFVMVVIYWLIQLLSISMQDASRKYIKSHPKTINHYQNADAQLPFSAQLMQLASQNKTCIVNAVYTPNKASVCSSKPINKTILIKKSILI